jgi:nicotinamidase-related amidase
MSLRHTRFETGPRRTALLVIDVQQGFAEIEAAGARRNNPEAETNIASLLAAFRDAGAAVIHVRHASREAGSRFRPEASGYAVMDCAREIAGEPMIVKHVNSAFIGTDLEARLRAGGISTLVITGATTNHCVETTTRMAGNLGFDARLVRDATWTFDRTGPDGELHTAEAIHQMTLANLAGEFATIVTTQDVIAALRAEPAAAVA